jgi:hypothetical protein
MTAEKRAAAKARRESMTPKEKAEGTAASAEKKEAPARKPGAPLPPPSAGPN